MTQITQEKIDPGEAKWASILVKLTWIVLVVGVVIGAIIFYFVDGTIALISIRQALLAERE